MRRFITISPFLLISIGFLIYALYALGATIFYSESEGWGILLAFIYAAMCVGVLIVDFVVKLIFRSRKKVIISQFVVLALIGIYHLLSDVKQTIQLPDDFGESYVTMIFEMDGEQKLPSRFMPFQDPLQANEDGYILTSSPLPSFIYGEQKYELKDDDGGIIGEKGNPYGFTTFPVYAITVQGKEYPYLTFKIESRADGCCGWSSQEINKHHKEVTNYLKNHLK